MASWDPLLPRVVKVVEHGEANGFPEGMTYQQIADALGIKRHSVQNAVRKGKARGVLATRTSKEDRRLRFVMTREAWERLQEVTE